MGNRIINSNAGTLSGTIVTVPEFSHSVYGERFYLFKLAVKRLSEKVDVIPVLASERALKLDEECLGRGIKVHGQVRSWNTREGRKSHLKMAFFLIDYEWELEEEVQHVNSLSLDGFICKPPIHRMTPLGRDITDLLLAVNRAYGRTDYVPCIAWGRNAKWVSGLGVGSQLLIEGRMQSREYIKRISENETETRTAYELSVSKITVLAERRAEEESNETVNREELEAESAAESA